MKMESTENYLELVIESWEDLKKAKAEGKFDPWRAEQDVSCFLYHCLVERAGSAKDIHAELQLKEGKQSKKVDLTIANKVFVDVKNILRARELNDIQLRADHWWRSRMIDAEKAIERLPHFMEKYAGRGILAIYTHSYIRDGNWYKQYGLPHDDEWYDEVERLCNDKKIIMLDNRDNFR
jgi:hypothetical protein